MTAKALLEKHGIKPNKNAREKVAVEKAVKDRAKRQVGVYPAGAGAQQRAVANDKAAVERTTEHIKAMVPKEGSRTAMMERAKDLGIKYFRILSKEDLTKVLSFGDQPDHVQQLQILSIQSAAKKRWQAGWGSKKKAEVAHE